MKQNSVFISGVAGFLGSHLADAFIADDYRVVGIDNLIGGNRGNIPPGCEFHVIDCNDFESVAKAMQGASIVYHCAATAYEGMSVFSPHFITQNIVTASTGMISAAIRCGVKRFVMCSSMARYGENQVPFNEELTPKPKDPYGIGKYAAELMLQNIADTHGMEWVVAVPHNIIGPRQKYDDPYRNVASIFINLILQDRQITIYGDGNQKRCFSFISDNIAPLKVMGIHEACNRQVINIGPDDEFITINELARTIADLIGKPLNLKYTAGRPQEVQLANCSADKARRMLAYSPKIKLIEGLEKMIDFIKNEGCLPFDYHLNLEIVTKNTPETWVNHLF